VWLKLNSIREALQEFKLILSGWFFDLLLPPFPFFSLSAGYSFTFPLVLSFISSLYHNASLFACQRTTSPWRLGAEFQSEYISVHSGTLFPGKQQQTQSC
jgi:hypothetical protein